LLATASNAHYEQLPAGDKAEVFGDMTAILFPEIPTRFYQCAFKYAGTALNRFFRGTPTHVLQEAREIPAPQPHMVFETAFVDGEWRVVKPTELPAVHEPKLPVKYEPKLPVVVDQGFQPALPANEPLPAPVLRLGGATTEVRVGEVPVRVQPALPANKPTHKTPAFKPAEAIREKAITVDKGKRIVHGAEAKRIGEAALIEQGIRDISRAIDLPVGMMVKEFLGAKNLQKPIIRQGAARLVEKEVADYWKSLMRDPDQGNKITQKTINETSAALKAVKLGILKGPLLRDTRGGDFIDALGQQWDVKACISHAPNGRYIFDADHLVKEFKIDIMCGENILLDLTLLEYNDFQILRQCLLSQLSENEVDKVAIVL